MPFNPMSRRSQPGRFVLVAILAATSAVFALVVGFLTLRLRTGLREQVLQREAAALTEVAALQLTNESETLGRLGIADAPGELLSAVLRTSRLRGVFAVRVFDRDERFNGALPLPWSEQPPAEPDWTALKDGRPIARLHKRSSAAEVIGLIPASGESANHPTGEEPLLETWLPLRRANAAQFLGAAQLWIDGRAVAGEFALIDRRLISQAVAAWLAGSALICGLVGWAFARLAAANRELVARRDELLRANRELTLAAKTSALGAVAAHLVHELKNPLAGLEEFVALQSSRVGTDDDVAAASELTQRLRTMINDVVGVMRDEQAGDQFELAGEEILSLVAHRLRDFAAARRITVKIDAPATPTLPARRANLAALVVYNLAQNAVEASAPGQEVALRCGAEANRILFSVTDNGPGIPATVRARLFQPTRSTKAGGSGLGLALSQQLARQAGGSIELTASDAGGTTFTLGLEVVRET